MSTILDGKTLSNKYKQAIADEIKRDDLKIKLAVILVGDDPASQIYVKNKIAACKSVGMQSLMIRFDADATQAQIIDAIRSLNEDDSVDGILVQLPLPDGLDSTKIINEVAADKDVDGLTYELQGKMQYGHSLWAPCTPQGVIAILDEYGISIDGKRAVVIGRSNLSGKPLATLLQERNATVTVCHSHTKDIKSITLKADILAVGVGKRDFIRQDMVKEGAVVIDIGINRDEDGVKGDVAFDEVSQKTSYITPVPGGVGPMTIAMLLENTLRAHKARKSK